MVKNPSDMIALGDAHLIYVWPDEMLAYGPEYAKDNYSGMGLLDINSRYGVQRPLWPGSEGIIDATSKRHRNKYNISFADGHVETIRSAELFEQSPEALKRWNNDNVPHAEYLLHLAQ
jgi:prepilin-type processing-associated H-X9-DG protein